EPTLLTRRRTGLIQIRDRRSVILAGGWVIVLLVLGFLWLIRDLFVPWSWMWLVAFAIFFGFKLLTLLRLDETSRRRLSLRRLATYLMLWPGLHPSIFAEAACEKRPRSRYLVANGCLQFLAGAIAIWAMPRW